MKIKDSATWPGFQAPSSRDVVKSTLLMARNDLPVGSGFIPAFVVIKLMILLGSARRRRMDVEVRRWRGQRDCIAAWAERRDHGSPT